MTCLVSPTLLLAPVGVAFMFSLLVIAIAYMAGSFFQSPRISVWAKTEIYQVFVSLLIVVSIVGILEFGCNMNMGGIYEMAGNPPVAGPGGSCWGAIPPSASLQEAGLAYLYGAADYSKRTLIGIRYQLGAVQIMSSRNTWTCEWFCLLGGQGKSYSEDAGVGMQSGPLSLMLQTAAVSLLSALFQIFTVSYFLILSSHSFLAILLVLGLFFRSMPFMRGFGGALIALAIVLFIIYPALLAIDYVIWPPVAGSCPPDYEGLERDLGGATGNWGWANPESWAIVSSGVDYYKDSSMVEMYAPWPDPPGPPAGCGTPLLPGCNPAGIPIPHSVEEGNALLFQFTAFSFISAVFLPTLNFVIMIALMFEISRMLGETMDISRLAQMV